MAPTAAFEGSHALPTLLTSQRRRVGPLSGFKPEPLTFEEAQAEEGQAEGQQAVAEHLPAVPGLELRVRNTFIDTVEEASPSAGFVFRRAVATCPSSRVGALLGSLDDLETTHEAAVSEEDPEELAWPGTATSVSRPSMASVAPPPPPPPPMPLMRSTLCLAEAIQDPHHSVHRGLAEPPMAPLPAWDMTWAAPGCSSGLPTGMVTAYPQTFQGPTHSVMATLPAPQMPVTCPAAPNMGYYMSAPTLEEDHIPPPPSRPALGSDELPSVGSAGHLTGECKPCAFYHSGRCGNGLKCQFCHLCDADERRRRRRDKLEAKKSALRASAAASAAAPGMATL